MASRKDGKGWYPTWLQRESPTLSGENEAKNHGEGARNSPTISLEIRESVCASVIYFYFCIFLFYDVFFFHRVKPTWVVFFWARWFQGIWTGMPPRMFPDISSDSPTSPTWVPFLVAKKRNATKEKGWYRFPKNPVKRCTQKIARQILGPFAKSTLIPVEKRTFKEYLGGGFRYFLFSPLFGEDFPFWLIFFKGVETTN